MSAETQNIRGEVHRGREGEAGAVQERVPAEHKECTILLYAKLSKSNEAGTEFPVHSVVLALHPMCGHLHTGSIMAYYKENLYMVRFHKP